MTEIRATGGEIAHHADGSIDFDFYRARAIALRRQAIQQTASLSGVCALALTLIGALAIAFLLAGPVNSPGAHVAAAASTAPIR